MKPFIMQFSPSSCFFLQRMPKYPPQHLNLRQLQSIFP